ncbi:MAG TPA: glycosyltransferase [Patescibacteria group bacterium]|nr:glycosyltransferase [Patescibacteria group bacterium]
MQDRVTFHGYVSRERLLELLIRSDIGKVPMLFDYQFPGKMFEFVSLGKPVVAFDLPEHRFTAQKAALCVQPNDVVDLACKIVALMDNQGQRNEIEEIGKK